MDISYKKIIIKYGGYIQFFIIAAFFLFLFSPIFPALFRDWTMTGAGFRSDNSHALLVPFISLFLIWMNHKKISWKNAHSSNIGLTILITGLVIYLVGYAAGIFVVTRVALIVTLFGLVIYNLGMEIFKSLVFPLGFLFFMIPIPYSILSLVSLPLQTMVTKVASYIIQNVFSLPVLREGNMLYFATTSLEVAEACSGIRSLMTFIMLGFLFAYMSEGSYKSKAIFLIMAIPLAAFTNLLRVTGTGVLAHFFGSKVAKGFLHEFSGFMVFAAGLLLMFGLWQLIKFLSPKMKPEKFAKNGM